MMITTMNCQSGICTTRDDGSRSSNVFDPGAKKNIGAALLYMQLCHDIQIAATGKAFDQYQGQELYSYFSVVYSNEARIGLYEWIF